MNWTRKFKCIWRKWGKEEVSYINFGRFAVAAARGIVQTYGKSLLAEFRSHIELTWAYSLLPLYAFCPEKSYYGIK